MERDDRVKEIIDTMIDIEVEAEEIFSKAKVIDSNSEKKFEEEAGKITAKSDERIKLLISKKEDECRKQYEAKLLKLNVQKSIMLQNMTEFFEQNKNSFVEKLYYKALEQ